MGNSRRTKWWRFKCPLQQGALGTFREKINDLQGKEIGPVSRH
jgi:hypothetical protein